MRYLKKLFNIACMLGLHDNVCISSLKSEEIAKLVINSYVDQGADPNVMYTMMLIGSPDKIYKSKVCVCCGKFTNEIYNHSLNLNKMYMKLYNKHLKAIDMYFTKHSDLFEQIRHKKDNKKRGWDLEDK